MEQSEKRVGVFMRVFRNEPEMHQMIQSVLGQTYMNIKYYVLVSNATKTAVEKYAEKDNRIVVIDGKIGEGFRKYAKMIARDGNAYILTVDADDWCEDTYIEELVRNTETYHTDIMACGNFFVDATGKRIGKRVQTKMVWDVEVTGEVLGYMYAFFRTIWGKIITSECILKCDFDELPLPSEYGGYGGDTILMFHVISKAKRIGICDKVLYNYRISPTGSSYKLSEGRLESDELLFHFVEQILCGFGKVGEHEYRFLLQVYGNALLDTTKLLLITKMTENERSRKLEYIFQKELSKELLQRERANALGIPESEEEEFTQRFYELIFSNVSQCAVTENTTKMYLSLFEQLYPKWKGLLSVSEFSIVLRSKKMLDSLINEEYQCLFDEILRTLSEVKLAEAKTCLRLLRRLTAEPLLKSLLQEKKFVIEYADIVSSLNKGEYKETLCLLHDCFEMDIIPYGDDALLELWINLAAYLEDVPEFILGKQIKAEVFMKKGLCEVGRCEYEELKQLGVQDENMEYLKSLFEK